MIPPIRRFLEAAEFTETESGMAVSGREGQGLAGAESLLRKVEKRGDGRRRWWYNM